MRIAIASSGLGHVARGIETWALDTAVAVAEVGGKRQTANGEFLSVTLFSGAPLSTAVTQASSLCSCACTTGKMPVSLCFASVTLPCLRRSSRTAQQLSNWAPPFLWRRGLKNPYGWEQLSFWLKLWPQLRRGRYDILHVQDPMVADWCRLFRKWGLVKTREILAHGTEEPVDFLAKFEYVQHLAPWHLDAGGGRHSKLWKAIPNFVDCQVFGRGDTGILPVTAAPIHRLEACDTGILPVTAAPTHRLEACDTKAQEHRLEACDTKAQEHRLEACVTSRIRERMGIPVDAFVVGCVAAVKKDHKRGDHLIRELGLLVSRYSLLGETTKNEESRTKNLYLLLAGARTDETDELIRLAEALIPGRYKILLDCPRDQMPDLYRTMDVFVLPSLFEMMPIALLEALASGLPCIVNRHPVLEWMVGSGETTDYRRQTEGRAQRAEGRGQTKKCENTPHLNPLPQGERKDGNRGTAPSPLRGEGWGEGASFHPGSAVCSRQSAVGPASGGMAIDMSREGALAEALDGLTPEWLEKQGRQARERAEKMFSKEAVIGQYVEYYAEVMRAE